MNKHCWRHTRRDDRFLTVVIDLTPVRNGTGRARLPDMVSGRSKEIFKTWLNEQTATFRAGKIEVVAMDGFTGSFRSAAAAQHPAARHERAVPRNGGQLVCLPRGKDRYLRAVALGRNFSPTGAVTLRRST